MFEIGVNEALQKLSSPFFDAVAKLFTELGSELFFLVIAIILYLCIDKKYAFKFVNVFFAGHFCVEATKLLVARPRPYTYDSVVSIGEETSGYSFPSGHSHSIANISTQLSLKIKKGWVIAVGSVVTLIVMFTRVYLGQHFVSDVLVGCAYGVGAALLFSYLYKFLGDNEEKIAYVTFPLCLILALVMYFTGNAEENFMVILGAYSAFSLGYYLEKRFIKLEVKSNKWYKHALKIAVALVVALALKEGLKLIMPDNVLIKEFVRYFIVAFVATFALPAL